MFYLNGGGISSENYLQKVWLALLKTKAWFSIRIKCLERYFPNLPDNFSGLIINLIYYLIITSGNYEQYTGQSLSILQYRFSKPQFSFSVLLAFSREHKNVNKITNLPGNVWTDWFTNFKFLRSSFRKHVIEEIWFYCFPSESSNKVLSWVARGL